MPNGWYFVYILKSLQNGDHYKGYTDQDVFARLANHNNGLTAYTAQHRPWQLKFYCAFPTKLQAIRFEKYLKSGSGIAFSNKRLIIKSQ